MKLRLPDNTLYRIAAFVVSALVIVAMLPRQKESRYVYEVNRPWIHSLLTAPFDIPVYLDSLSAQEVKDSIERNFEPVYERDMTVEKAMVAEFSRRLNRMAVTTLTPQGRNRLVDGFKRLFNDGIVNQISYSEIREGRMPSVRFIHDNVAISMPTAAFKSPRAAYATLDSLFSAENSAAVLAQLNPQYLLKPNVTIDSAETVRLYNDLYTRAMAPIGVIQQGERIIDRGDIVTPGLAQVLETYEDMAGQRNTRVVSAHHYPVVGQALYVALLLVALYFYLLVFRPRYFKSGRTVTFLLLMLVGFTVLGYAMANSFVAAIYILPFAIVPILAVIFLDSRTAMYLHILLILMVAVTASYPLEFIFIQFLAGTGAIDSIKDLSKRSQLIFTALLVFAGYALGYIAMEIMVSGTLDKLSPRMIGYFGINAVLVSFAYVLMFLVEKSFGFTSRVTLVELSDINNPILRTLSEECPGTFQHSMAVSNLASAAASRIGANVQLVRAGALYHDIGKIKNPAFFTENQHGVNPHTSLDPMRSAGIVIGHVTEGLRMAEKAKLPSAVKDFIAQHHGTGKARYFYNTWCNSHPDQEVDPKPFTYPGPNPRTREASILMMADAVEAASRSLTDHSPEAIKELVDRLIDTQIKEGLHNDSAISFHDVSVIKEIFAQRLSTMFHSRIAYPDNVKEQAEAETTEKPLTNQ